MPPHHHGPKFSQFYAGLGKFDKIVCWAPLPGGLAPSPTENPGSTPGEV